MFEVFERHPKRWSTVAGAAAVALPMLLAFHLASVQSQWQQEREAALLVDAILLRSHEAGAQVARAEQALSIPELKPCTPEHLQRMARMHAENPLVVGFGYMQGNLLVCSSFGALGANLDLGPADYLSRRNIEIRSRRPLPGITDRALHFSTDPRTGFTAIVHPDVTVGLLTHDPSISLGVINTTNLVALAQQGTFDAAWIEKLGEAREARFFDGRYVVAMRRSDRFDFAAYAAIPLENMDRGTASLILLLAPLGIGSGFLLAYLVFRFTRHRTSTLWQFKQALRRHELFLVYQPIVDLQSSHWVGAEALLRWRRSDGSMVSPDIFIPLAERHQLMGQVTMEVIRLFVHDLRAMLHQHPAFRISLNFCAADLEDPVIVHKLHEAITEAGLQHRNVQVEATERGLLDAERTRRVLRDLQNLGIRVAIDDFGTGYSSLSYLTTLEVDSLKIDKSFVETIGTDAATSQVVSHIIEMGKSLQLSLIAEGVETTAQAEYLRAHGVHQAQGWLYAKPMSAEDLTAGLQRQSAA